MRKIIDLVESLEDWPPKHVPVEPLARMFNPFKWSPWRTKPIDRDDVASALRDYRLASDPYRLENDKSWITGEGGDYVFHVQRIAYLVRNPDDTPIDLVLTIYDTFDLDDGYHRLAAAIFRGDATIPANVGGPDETFDMWLGINPTDQKDIDENQPAV